MNVITFLDECVQRCLQTPYRYVEVLRSLALSTASSNGCDLDPLGRVNEFPSPLFMTLLEQLEAKLKNKSLAPACLVGVATFIGTLTFYLSSKTKDLGILKVYADRVDAVLSQDVHARVVNIAVRKMLTILRCSLTFKTCQQLDEMSENEELQIWLLQTESLPIGKGFRFFCPINTHLVP
jgi:nucleolar pre-ribosomal-associated protein 1